MNIADLGIIINFSRSHISITKLILHGILYRHINNIDVDEYLYLRISKFISLYSSIN